MVDHILGRESCLIENSFGILWRDRVSIENGSFLVLSLLDASASAEDSRVSNEAR